MTIRTKDIDAAREARLWARDIIIPTAMVVIAIVSNEDARTWVGDKMEKAKNGVKILFKK